MKNYGNMICESCGKSFKRTGPRQIRCCECAEELNRLKARQKYREKAAERRLEQERANARAYYARSKGRADKPRAVKEAPKDSREGVKSPLCDMKTCARCIYSFSLSGALACDYILATGHSRGCPAGTGCDKRQTGKRKKEALRI